MKALKRFAYYVSAVALGLAVSIAVADVHDGSLQFMPNPLVFLQSSSSIRTNTADAADNKLIDIAGGGAAGDKTRGAYIDIAGNEQTLNGQVQIFGGNTDTGSGAGDIDLHCTNTLGAVTFFTGDVARWAVASNGNLTSNATNGGNLLIQKASTGLQVDGGTIDSTVTAVSGTYPPLLSIVSGNSLDTGTFASYGNNSSGVTIDGLKTRSTSASAPATTVITSGDDILTLAAYAADGTNYKIAGSLKFQSDGASGTNDVPGRFLLSTTPDGSATQSPRLSVLNTGTVGIGSADITAIASDVTNVTGTGLPLFMAFNGNSADFAAIGSYGNNAAGVQWDFMKTREGSHLDADVVVQSGDSLGAINFFGSDGTVFRKGASITSSVDATPGSADLPANLIFNVTLDGASSPTQALKIANDKSATFAGTITSSATGTLGWSVVTGANTACTTTCTSACMGGQDTDAASKPIVDCADTSADRCYCAGAS